MNKVALFDFCETIANFQTADAYVDFVREKLRDKRMCRLERMQNCMRRLKLIQLVDKLTGYRYSFNKRIKLYQLRGLPCSELRQLAMAYYNERIRPNFIPDVLEKLLALKELGYSVLLVSGGYDIYLQYFVDEFALTDLISTKVGFKDDVCTGKFDGIDCLREGKIEMLNQYFVEKPNYSVAFSDSISDLPFLKWVNEGFVVSRNFHQEWSTMNNLKELIWIPKK